MFLLKEKLFDLFKEQVTFLVPSGLYKWQEIIYRSLSTRVGTQAFC